MRPGAFGCIWRHEAVRSGHASRPDTNGEISLRPGSLPPGMPPPIRLRVKLETHPRRRNREPRGAFGGGVRRSKPMRIFPLMLAACLAARAAVATPDIGAPAPVFQARDADGRPVALALLRGKIVVLEWTNNGCPFV